MDRIKPDKTFFIDVFRAALIAVLISIIAVILFALIFKAFEFGGTALKIGNEIIKLVSLLIGSFFGIKVMKQGVLKGFLIGVLFLLFSILIMRVFNSDTGGPLFTLLNVGFSLLFGAVSGIFSVNFKKR